MPKYKYKYRRRRRGRKRRYHKRNSVKALIKKEVNKSREQKKIVSFMMNRPIRSLNTEVLGLANTPWENTVVYSLTGGRMGDGMNSNDVLMTANTPSSLFAIRPAFSTTGVDKVALGGEGGQVDSSANTQVDSKTTSGVHVLQGRECWLKNFYCNIRINNAGHQAFTTPNGDDVPAVNPQSPISQYVRLLVVETRKPLLGMRSGGAYNSLANQLLLQIHSGDGTGTQVPTDINADAVSGFLNLQTIKKIHYDKLIQLGDGDNVTAKFQFITKLRFRLNRKAYWNYLYDIPANTGEPVLKYQGPWFYLVAFGSNAITQSLDVAPRMNISSILTFYDD